LSPVTCYDYVDKVTSKRAGILTQSTANSSSQQVRKRKGVVFSSVDLNEDSSRDSCFAAPVHHYILNYYYCPTFEQFSHC